MFLSLLPYVRLTPQVRPEDGRDLHSPVGFLVVFKNRDQDAGARNGRVVEGVAELHLAVRVPITKVEAASLEVVKPRGGNKSSSPRRASAALSPPESRRSGKR